MKRLPIFICLPAALLLLYYTIIRAYKLSFTHDESYTYLYSSLDSFMQIISNRTTEISANNHILNTLFMKLFDNVFGSFEFSLRLQSILAHIVYMIFTFLIVKQFRSVLVITAGFIILNINPYLLDFFSLARGYALAIAFMVMSIYYFIRYTNEEKSKNLIYSALAACLAVLANFALLNYLAALLLIQQIYLYLKFRNLGTNVRKSKAVGLIMLILILICYEPLRKLIKYGRFDFGGSTGIWEDTVKSEIHTFLYDQKYPEPVFSILGGSVFIIMLITLIILILKIKNKTINQADKIGIIFYSTLILILLSNTAQHFLFGSPYIAERFALFITPLFLFTFIYLMEVLLNSAVLRVTSAILMLVITAFMTYHFVNCANTNYTLNWNYDSDTKTMLADLQKEKEASGSQKINLGITWWFEPSINFYRKTKKLNWLEKVTRKGPSGEYDYYFVSSIEQNLVPPDRKTIKEYPASASRLMQ